MLGMRISRKKGLLQGSAGLVVILAVTLCTSGPTGAAWTKVSNVSGVGWQATDSPQVSVDRQGDALFVWSACEMTQSSCYYQINARLKPKGQPMERIQNLSPLGADPAWPQVASDDVGDSAVVWQQDGYVVGRRISGSGAVGLLTRLSPSSAMNPVVVVTPQGRALAAWNAYSNGTFRMQARFFYQDGSLGPVLDLGPGAADLAGIGIDRHGTAVLAWTQDNQNVVAQRIRPGHLSRLRTFTAPIAGKGGFGPPSVAVDRDGDATLLFRSAGGAHARVWARRWKRDGSLGKLLAASPRTQDTGFHYTVASDLQGDSILAWTSYTDSRGARLYARRLSRYGALGGVIRLALGDRPDVALDDDGDGLVAWHSPGDPYSATEVQGSRIPRSGPFGRVRTFTSDGRVPQVSTSPLGRFTLVWQQASGPYPIRMVSGR